MREGPKSAEKRRGHLENIVDSLVDNIWETTKKTSLTYFEVIHRKRIKSIQNIPQDLKSVLGFFILSWGITEWAKYLEPKNVFPIDLVAHVSIPIAILNGLIESLTLAVLIATISSLVVRNFKPRFLYSSISHYMKVYSAAYPVIVLISYCVLVYYVTLESSQKSFLTPALIFAFIFSLITIYIIVRGIICPTIQESISKTHSPFKKCIKSTLIITLTVMALHLNSKSLLSSFLSGYLVDFNAIDNQIKQSIPQAGCSFFENGEYTQKLCGQ